MTAPRKPRKTYDSEIIEDTPLVRRPTATTREARENQLVGMAFDLAEKQIIEGTASSQVITHFLKLGSTRERAEQEKLRLEAKLAETKIENLASQSRVEELYESAINALRGYSGQDDEGEDQLELER